MIDLGRGLRVGDAELVYRATRAGGPGGQHVNKTATRIELTWNVAQSPSLDERTRARLLARLASRLDATGALRIVVATERSQRRNRELALERLQGLIAAALATRKRRNPTRPTRASKERRLGEKRRRGEVKAGRRSKPAEE